MDKVLLTVPESLQYAQDTAYWDGFASGAQSAAEHAKQLIMNKIIKSRKPTPPPVQPEVVPEG